MNKVAGRMGKEQALMQARIQAESIIRQTVQTQHLPVLDSLPQNMVNEVLHFHEFLKEAERGRLRKFEISCAHCSKEAIKFLPVSSKDVVSTYCSPECRQSKLNHLPAGVVCRTPRKTAYLTLTEAQEATSVTNARISKEGDVQGVQSYECICNNWHNGHKEDPAQLAWKEAASSTITILTNKIMTLV